MNPPTAAQLAAAGLAPIPNAYAEVLANGKKVRAWNGKNFVVVTQAPFSQQLYAVPDSWEATTPPVTPPVTPPPVETGVIVGINDHDLMWASNPPLAQLKALGAKVHRCDLGAEAQFNTAYNFGDCLGTPGCAGVVGGWASQLRTIDCQPMIVFGFTSLPTPSVFADDLAALVEAVPGLWIEVGNELDAESFSIPEYITLLAAAVTAAHEADPTCKIGPSPVGNINYDGSGWNWLEKAFAAGLAAIPYDFLPFHNYPWPTALAPTVDWAGTWNAETLIAPFIAQCATWGNKAPCWLTEFGWQSTDTSATPNMTEALQASYLSEFIQSAEVQSLPVAIIYELGDGGGQVYGLIDAGGTKKPAFAAVSALA